MKTMTTDILVKHGFPSTRDVYLMHGSNGVFLPRGCNGTIFFILAPRPFATFVPRNLKFHTIVDLHTTKKY